MPAADIFKAIKPQQRDYEPLPGKLPIPSRPFVLRKREQNTIKIAIKELKGQPFTIEIDELSTIYAVKKRILEQLQLNEVPRLLLKGKPMLDFKCVRDYQIKNNETLILSIKKAAEPEKEAEIIPAVSAEVDVNLNSEIFYNRLSNLLDSRYNEETSVKIFEEFKHILEKYD